MLLTLNALNTHRFNNQLYSNKQNSYLCTKGFTRIIIPAGGEIQRGMNDA